MEFGGGDDRLALYVNCGAMQWGELCPLPKKSYVQAPTHLPTVCDLIWKQSLCRCHPGQDHDEIVLG